MSSQPAAGETKGPSFSSTGESESRMSQHQEAPTPASSIPTAPLSLEAINIIRPFGYSEIDCGYCKGTRRVPGKNASNSSKSYGILAENWTPALYEAFLYRGWRRSGIHMYRPTNFESCCPTLTIRLLAPQFKPTKSQQRVRRKMEHLLHPPYTSIHSEKTKEKLTNEQQQVQDSGVLTKLNHLTANTLQTVLVAKIQVQASSVRFKVRRPSKEEMERHQITCTSAICAQLAGKHAELSRDTLVQNLAQSLQQQQQQQHEHQLPFPLVQYQAHLKSGQLLVTLQLPAAKRPSLVSDDVSMVVNDRDDKLENWFHANLKMPLKSRKLEIQTLPAHESALDPQVHRLYAHYQHVVHQDPDPFHRVINNNDNKSDSKPATDDTQTPTPPMTVESLDWGNAPTYFVQAVQSMLRSYLAAYEPSLRRGILENYYSFYQFLVEAPFALPSGHKLREGDCGSFHQHYRLNGLLIAVGIVDVLPQGLSSVYLIYHPKFAHDLVALGKLATLHEIDYTRRFPSPSPTAAVGKPYYYLGYYIHSCQKMRYKSDYHPSQLLCPVTGRWVDAGIAISKLEAASPRHVCRLVEASSPSAVATEEEENVPTTETLDQVAMDIGAGMTVTLSMLQPSGQGLVQPILTELVQEAGIALCRQCLVKLT